MGHIEDIRYAAGTLTLGEVTFFHIDDMGYAGGTSCDHIGDMRYADGTLMSLWGARREGGISYV